MLPISAEFPATPKIPGNERNARQKSSAAISGRRNSATAETEALLTEHEVAKRQARSVRTLQSQRIRGGGIPYLKLGRSVRYRLSDVVAWEAARRCMSTSAIHGSGADA